MVLITIVTGAYKPTYNWGASHCMYIGIFPLDYMGLYELYIHTWIIYIHTGLHGG